MIREELSEIDEEILCVDGFDEALIGYVERFGHPTVALYDRKKYLQIIMQDGFTYEEAVEHFEFNIIGGWVGEYTPSFATILKED